MPVNAREDDVQQPLDIRQLFRIGGLQFDDERRATGGDPDIAITLQPSGEGCLRCSDEIRFARCRFDPTLDIALLLESATTTCVIARGADPASSMTETSAAPHDGSAGVEHEPITRLDFTHALP